MANLQVKNLPSELHQKLVRRAKQQGRTIRDLVLDAVQREIDRTEFQDRLARRPPVDLGRPAARALGEVRAAREGRRRT